MTAVRCPVHEGAQISRDEPALILDDRKITYSELEFYVAGACTRLRQAGCGEGDRVALRADEPWQTAVLLMALLRLKAVTCLTAGDGTDGENTALADCRYRFEGPECGRLLPVHIEGQGTAEASMLNLEQPATVVLHRDRAGRLQGILHSVGSHYYGARGANHAIRLSSGSRWCSAHPLHDAAGLSALFRCLWSGAAMAVPSPGQPLKRVLQDHKATHVDLPADALERLLQEGKREDFPRLRVVLLNGGEAHPDLLRKAREAGFPLCPAFGIPEVASGLTAAVPDTPPARQCSSGMVMKYREMSLGASGTILVRGPAVFTGYISGPAPRRETDADGWFDTGLRGEEYRDGYWTIRDDRKAVPA